MPHVLFLRGADLLALDVFLDAAQQVVEAGSQDAELVMAAQVGEVIGIQSTVGVHAFRQAARAPGELSDAPDDADLDDQPGQPDGPEHGADEPRDARRDGAEHLVHAARITLQQDAVIAERRRHLVRQFNDRRIQAFDRQPADQPGEQRRGLFERLVTAGELDDFSVPGVGAADAQAFAGQQQAAQAVERERRHGARRIAVEQSALFARCQHFDTHLELVEIGRRPGRLVAQEKGIAQDVYR